MSNDDFTCSTPCPRPDPHAVITRQPPAELCEPAVIVTRRGLSSLRRLTWTGNGPRALWKCQSLSSRVRSHSNLDTPTINGMCVNRWAGASPGTFPKPSGIIERMHFVKSPKKGSDWANYHVSAEQTNLLLCNTSRSRHPILAAMHRGAQENSFVHWEKPSELFFVLLLLWKTLQFW